MSKYKPKIYEVFLDISKIFEAPIEKGIGLGPYIQSRLLEVEHIGVLHSPETNIRVHLEKEAKNKWRVDIELNWSTSTYDPLLAVVHAQQHMKAALLSVRALTVATGWRWTQKEVDRSWGEYESYLKMQESEDDDVH